MKMTPKEIKQLKHDIDDLENRIINSDFAKENNLTDFLAIKRALFEKKTTAHSNALVLWAIHASLKTFENKLNYNYEN